MHPIDSSLAAKDKQATALDALLASQGNDELGMKVVELAQLSPLEYDQHRKNEAENLGVRVETLDKEVRKVREPSENGCSGMSGIEDLEPWPEPVNGSELLSGLAESITRYCVLPDGAAEAVALWVLHTYCLDAATISPILLIHSPEKRCGKSTLLAVLTFLVRRPAPASNISPAVLYRAIEKYRVTLLIDEADTFLVGRNANDELRGVINSGHTRFNAYVWRNEGDNHEPKRFSTWGAKAIALIGNAQDTIMDRSIVIPMRRKMPGETVSRLRIDRPEVFEGLTRKCQRWAEDNLDSLKENCEPDVPGTLHDRAADNWRPLLAIAELAGWRKQADDAIQHLNVVEDQESTRTLLLCDIRDLFESRKTDKLWSEEIVSYLETLTDRPWPEWKGGKPMSQVQLARQLKSFKIKPQTIRIDDATRKGYERAQFEDVFSRYAPLGGNRNVTTSQVNGGTGSGGFRSVTEKNGVTDRNAREPLSHKGCDVVTDQITGTGVLGENGEVF